MDKAQSRILMRMHNVLFVAILIGSVFYGTIQYAQHAAYDLVSAVYCCLSAAWLIAPGPSCCAEVTHD